MNAEDRKALWLLGGVALVTYAVTVGLILRWLDKRDGRLGGWTPKGE